MPRKSSRPMTSGHPAAKPTMDEMLALRSRFNKASTDFLKLDLNTALTFTRLARESDNEIKRERNRRSARKAYDTVLRLKQKISLNEGDAKQISENLERLKSELISLGEVL